MHDTKISAERRELMAITYGDRSHATLRSLVATVQRELASTTPSDALRAAWDELVTLLSLGVPPEMKSCPTCGQLGMSAASRCRHCWASLAPAVAHND